jgi:hypothetical protein
LSYTVPRLRKLVVGMGNAPIKDTYSLDSAILTRGDTNEAIYYSSQFYAPTHHTLHHKPVGTRREAGLGKDIEGGLTKGVVPQPGRRILIRDLAS